MTRTAEPPLLLRLSASQRERDPQSPQSPVPPSSTRNYSPHTQAGLPHFPKAISQQLRKAPPGLQKMGDGEGLAQSKGPAPIRTSEMPRWRWKRWAGWAVLGGNRQEGGMPSHHLDPPAWWANGQPTASSPGFAVFCCFFSLLSLYSYFPAILSLCLFTTLCEYRSN